MSTASDEFRLQLPVESASWACREAIVAMGWEVESIEPHRLMLRRSWWGFSRDPSTIEVRPRQGPAPRRSRSTGASDGGGGASWRAR